MYALMSAAAYMFHDINERSISQSSSRFSFTYKIVTVSFGFESTYE